jgi:hypothetical protein
MGREMRAALFIIQTASSEIIILLMKHMHGGHYFYCDGGGGGKILPLQSFYNCKNTIFSWFNALKAVQLRL